MKCVATLLIIFCCFNADAKWGGVSEKAREERKARIAAEERKVFYAKVRSQVPIFIGKALWVIPLGALVAFSLYGCWVTMRNRSP